MNYTYDLGLQILGFGIVVLLVLSIYIFYLVIKEEEKE